MYSTGKTIAKTIVPSAIVIGGSNLLQVASAKVGLPLTDEMSYSVIVGIYSLIRGIQNWIKNRRR